MLWPLPRQVDLAAQVSPCAGPSAIGRRGELIKAARAFPYQDICKLIRVGESVYRVDSRSGAPHSSDNFPPSSRRDSILPTPVFSDVKTTTSCAFFSIQLRHGLLRLTTTMTSHNFTNACRCVFYINLFLRFINLFLCVPNVDFMSTGLSCFRSKHISQFMFYFA